MARVQPKKAAASKPATAKARPAVKTPERVSSEELEVAPEKTVSFDNGVRKEEGSEIIIERDAAGFKEKAAMLAFMEEELRVIISQADGKNPETHIFLAVNGVGPGPNGMKWVPRGVEIPMKRKFLSVLAGARPVKYSNYEETNTEGVRESKQRAIANDRYPFSVVFDPNPRGMDWLRQLRATNRAG
jgi:hypothetical protein